MMGGGPSMPMDELGDENSMAKMMQMMAKVQTLNGMKPSERAAMMQKEQLDEVNDKLKEIEDEITEEDIALGPKLIVDGEMVKQYLDECPDHECEEEPFAMLDPSKIGMSAEDYVSMMLKAEEGQRLYLAAMLLSAKLNLLHAKEELKKPLPDMTEKDKAFEERQAEEESRQREMLKMLEKLKASMLEDNSEFNSAASEYGSDSETEEDQEYDTVETEFDSEEEDNGQNYRASYN